MERPLAPARELMHTTRPDFVLPSQYVEPRRKPAPEKWLMIAVLHDALDCLEKYRSATDSHDRRLFREAKQWFLAHQIGWPYSFERICGVLDLDSNVVRRRLGVAPQPQTSSRAACGPPPEPLAALRRLQFDPTLDTASQQKASALIWKFQANGWDEV